MSNPRGAIISDRMHDMHLRRLWSPPEERKRRGVQAPANSRSAVNIHHLYIAGTPAAQRGLAPKVGIDRIGALLLSLDWVEAAARRAGCLATNGAVTL